jgi:hypothetical protein
MRIDFERLRVTGENVVAPQGIRNRWQRAIAGLKSAATVETSLATMDAILLDRRLFMMIEEDTDAAEIDSTFDESVAESDAWRRIVRFGFGEAFREATDKSAFLKFLRMLVSDSNSLARLQNEILSADELPKALSTPLVAPRFKFVSLGGQKPPAPRSPEWAGASVPVISTTRVGPTVHVDGLRFAAYAGRTVQACYVARERPLPREFEPSDSESWAQLKAGRPSSKSRVSAEGVFFLTLDLTDPAAAGAEDLVVIAMMPS